MNRNSLTRRPSLLLVGTVAAAFCAVFCAACTSAVPGDDSGALSGGQPVEVSFSLATRATDASIDKADQPEYTINSVRIYAFQGDELVGYHHTPSFTTGSNMPTVAIEDKMTLPTGRITFYTIVNEAAAGPLKQNNTDEVSTLPDASNIEASAATVTPNYLLSLTFSTLPSAKLASTNGSTPNLDEKDETKNTYTSAILPMASVQPVSITSATTTVQLEVTRSVARLNLRFAKKEPTGEEYNVYMGRGLYLYNVPQYGYLFAKARSGSYTGAFSHLEDGTIPGVTSDSQLHQRNGMVILHSGWPAEPENAASTNDPEFLNTHINEITTPITDADKQDITKYQPLPQKPIYLFANPYRVAGNPANPKDDDKQRGYYIKILTHEHKASGDNTEGHLGEMYYVRLPAIEANQSVTLCSLITAEFESLMPHWTITNWKSAGADITFD